MFKIAIILAISAICFAADALPASTVSAVKAYDAEMAKAKAEYDRKDDVAKKVLVAALTKAQAAEMKANNLEGALAIKKRIEELSKKSDDLLGDSLETRIVGNWKFMNHDVQGYFNIKNDGTVESNYGACNWKIDGNTIVLVQNGNTHIISMVDDNNCNVIRGNVKFNLIKIK